MSVSTSQRSHSQRSLSPSASQYPSSFASDVPLDRLVQHLLASKRSLSSIAAVWRAKEIVTAARSTLVETVVLNSRAGFIHSALMEQTAVLHRVHGGVDGIRRNGQHDFEAMLNSLDEADSLLQETMDILKSTIVAAALRPDGEEQRNLLDFVDEGSVEIMRAGLKQTIDHSQDAQAEFLSSIEAFNTELDAIKAALAIAIEPLQTSTRLLPPLVNELESGAAEMASLLESLSSHFDLCVVAIKNTEGGRTAVENITTADPSLPSLSIVIGSPASSAHLVPMSDEERQDMLQVLSNDAAEVDDVVLEIHQLLSTMEASLSQVLEHASGATQRYMDISSVFDLLTLIGSKLPSYITSSQSYLQHWLETKTQLTVQMEELNGMREFYDGYLSSYDGLLVETKRRKDVEDKMKSVLRKALDTVQRMHGEDASLREDFRRDVGEYLPSDLWQDLPNDAPKWEVVMAGKANDI